MTVKKVQNPRLTQAEKNIATLMKRRVYVGIPGSAGLHPGSKATNAVIGYVQEHGDDERGIPARPFLVPGVANAGPKISANLKKAFLASCVGNSDGVDNALQAVGLICQAAVKQKMIDGPFRPLNDATIYNRQHRKSLRTTSTKPLLDTRALFNAITFVIGEK
ncbi:MAG: hypothetical protein P4L76_05300 [Beijerinckiaceae bacterium]|nr:hypothetical protein [Beijerinckiaceae bacterium]